MALRRFLDPASSQIKRPTCVGLLNWRTLAGELRTASVDFDDYKLNEIIGLLLTPMAV